VFDGGLDVALRIGLQQTPFLNVLAPDKVTRVLSQISHGQEPLTLDRALQVCRKTNSTAVLIGSIADAGNQYDVSIHALRCDTSAMVAQSETTAKERNQIVAEIGLAAVDLRKKLGESNTTLQGLNQPLGQATSSSVEALKLYAEAVRRGNQRGDTTAITEMLQVIEKDPSFALAYRRLAAFYNNIGELSAMRDNIRKAFDLRQQLTKPERFRVESSYYTYFTGEWERSVAVLQEMSREYPNDSWPPNNATPILRDLGEPERAAAAAQEAIRLAPDSYNGYFNLMYSEINRNRWDEAKAVYEQALSRGIDVFNLHTLRYLIAFLERDVGVMQKELEWERTDPRANGALLFSEASRQLYFGHAKLARKFLDEGLAKQSHAGLKELPARSLCSFAWAEVEIGEAQRARQDMTEALQMSPSSPEVKSCSALLLARLGDPSQAENMAAQINAEMPLATMQNATEVPTLKAAAMLAEGNPTEALNVLEPSVPYFRSLGNVVDGRDAAYLRGIALLNLKKGQQAALEFQRIIDSPGLVALSIKGALVHVQLARAQVMMGDKEAARKSYQDFLILWKDADPDIPIYKEAKAEHAKLHLDRTAPGKLICPDQWHRQKTKLI
jgi:eukaryotic-like serine/threonine-protein kinase